MMAFQPTSLSTVCEIAMGQAPNGESYNTTGEGHPLIAGAGDFGEITPSPGKWTVSPTKLSASGDIILCIRATIGDLNWSDKEYCLGRGVAGLRSNGAKLDQNYLWHWLSFSADELKSKGRGATFLQVSKADIGSLQIPLPPLAEQKRIAAILDAADALPAKRRESLAQLDTLLQSTFLDMFGDPVTNPKGWEIRLLGELVREKGDIVDGPFGSAINVKEDYSENGAVPVVRTKNVSPFEFITVDLKFISEEKFNQVRRSEVLPGDIILTKVGTIGHVCFFPDTFGKGVLSTTGSCRIRPDSSRMNSVFLARYLHIFRPQMLTIAAMGVQPFLNMQHIKSFPVFLPPLDLQQRFASLVKLMEQQKSMMREHLAELDTLFASLQHRAFNGEL